MPYHFGTMIPITDRIAIAESEIEESYQRASGPGGQNVNTLSSAVRLRFDVRNSPTLPEAVKERLERLGGRRINRDGVLMILAQCHRTQEANRRDALERLIALIRDAVPPPIPRRPTRPTLGSRTRRLDGKAQRAEVKAMRRSPTSE
ncbi:alternative ribosome rescue aminoacyl-tRNA hydrolase ArfB [Magnetospirillum molischianum]|uniref:Putative Class I peptide chain release factor domain protein n=1 Tax=Magnetospirillum molischianum DSM 120 TaxID=1150626 RepID=H8FQ47_MAGML|nr:alternative ribosome rescue aminoacyl-tRNA hydrolase ArfB [Magnetospirillum molischianum]CCG40485.1 putative Class I peptide chain release factor domain protein [Magnetospirillum molischianum DSM 120]